ncbi:MAG: TonB C-terminal domain-containing protein [Candidatus Melainabacteria bacterium]|nr:TonB C-terminal domain-containing protein [Candidatus Melainabacteria bacterium]
MFKCAYSRIVMSVVAASLLTTAAESREYDVSHMLIAGGKSTEADGASLSTTDPDKFMAFYYSSIKKADKLDKLLPFYTRAQLDDMDRMKKQAGTEDGIDMDGLMLEMLKSEQPTEVRILSATRAADRVEYKLEPANLPPDKLALKEKGNFTMTGELVLVREDGKWKVYKDYWQSHTKDDSGEFSSSFGINPDRKKEREAQAISEPPSFDSQFRDKFFKEWTSASGKGNVYVAVRLGDNGEITESYFMSKEAGQEKSVEAIKDFFSKVTDLPPLPDEFKSKPYAWMSFSWSEKGARAISGPYFDDEFPDWVSKQRSDSVK